MLGEKQKADRQHFGTRTHLVCASCMHTIILVTYKIYFLFVLQPFQYSIRRVASFVKHEISDQIGVASVA